MPKDYFIVHHTDLDGIAAALIVARRLKSMKTDGRLLELSNFVDFIPHSYDKDLRGSEVLLNNGKYKGGYVVDLSFTKDTVDQLWWLRDLCDKLTWLDHHVSSLDVKDDPELQSVTKVIDTGRSGAMIAWRTFFPEEGVPLPVFLVDDYDRWVHNSPDSRKLNAGVRSNELSVSSVVLRQIFIDNDDNTFARTLLIGAERLLEQDKINQKLRENRLFRAKFDKNGYWTDCYAMNANGNSDLFGEYLKDDNLCVLFTFMGDKWVYSLYSKSVDCEALAKSFGGGGHKAAAGFSSAAFLFDAIEKVF